MAFHLTLPCFTLSTCPAQDGSPELAAGPFKFWLGRNMLGLVWRSRFDLIAERTSYHPEGGRWFETWQESPEERGGYFPGWKWNLLTGNSA